MQNKEMIQVPQPRTVNYEQEDIGSFNAHTKQTAKSSEIEMQETERELDVKLQIRDADTPNNLQDNNEDQNNEDQNNEEGRGFKRNLERISNTIVMDHRYFHEGNSQQQKEFELLITPQEYFKLQSFCTSWSQESFNEFFLYHLIFIFLFGPLTGLILKYFIGEKLLKNMEFLGCRYGIATQSVIYFGNLFVSITYFAYPNEDIVFVVLLSVWILLLFRIIIISAKYATLPKEKIYLYKNFILENDFRYRDMMSYQLIKTSMEEIYQQSYNSFKKLEFEPQQFFISFSITPKIEVAEELVQMSLDLSDYHHQSDPFQPEPFHNENEYCEFYGFAIICKFINEFEKNSLSQTVFYPSFILSAGFTILPILYAVYRREKMQISVLEVSNLVVLMAIIFYGTYMAFVFLFLGIRELQKKLYMVVQCAQLISPKNIQYCYTKLLPTVNIFNPSIIQAWSMLRQVCFGYGYPYFLRIQCYYTVLIAVIFFQMIFLLLFLMNLVDVSNYVAIYILIWTSVLISLLSLMLMLVAKINSFFDEYKKLLQDLLGIFLDIKRMDHYYFKENLVPQNFLHKKFVGYLQQRVDEDGVQINDYLEQINISIEDAMRNIDYDQRNNTLEFFGVPITYEILSQVVVGIATVFGFAIQYYLKLEEG